MKQRLPRKLKKKLNKISVLIEDKLKETQHIRNQALIDFMILGYCDIEYTSL